MTFAYEVEGPAGTALAAGSQDGAIATVHPLASQAGSAAFARGGNAIDAAVAAALTLGVVDTHNSGIGGGCFMLIRTADGAMLAIDGREMAPAAYDHALRIAGELPLRQLLRDAADLADNGFEIDATYAQRLAAERENLSRFAASRSIFLLPDGTAPAQGYMLRQPDLARSYRRIADEGMEWFYGGEFAHRLEAWMRDNGGILTAEDFAGYELKRRRPLVSRYRGHTIIGFPPPSSGGVHVAQILNIVEAYDARHTEVMDDADRLHVLAEAMKLAFADRAHWLGDPDFADVPRGLIDETYAAALADRIDPDRAIEVPGAGKPPGWETDLFGKHTTHIAAADAEGNWVAITTTLNTAFGSKVVIPGTGILMNNQMDDFSARPGVPNAFGLIGAEANSIQPRKRPLSSMSPTIVLRDDEPVMTLGAAGGPTIISQVVQAIIHTIDHDASLMTLAVPRIHHQWRPNVMVVEQTLDEAIIERLRARGHEVEVRPVFGATQGVQRSPAMPMAGRLDGWIVGFTDPRVQGRPMPLVRERD